jgi:hypothetical protein
MSQLHTGRIALHPTGGIGGSGASPQPLAAACSVGVISHVAANSPSANSSRLVIVSPLL